MLFIQIQFWYDILISLLMTLSFNTFSFHQKINTHILDIVFITRFHIFLSEIRLKFVFEFLVLIFLIGRWSIGQWLVHLVGGGLLVAQLVYGQLVGGFTKTLFKSHTFKKNKTDV